MSASSSAIPPSQRELELPWAFGKSRDRAARFSFDHRDGANGGKVLELQRVISEFCKSDRVLAIIPSLSAG